MLTPQVPSTKSYIRTLNLIGWSLVIFLGLFTQLSTLDLLVSEFLPGTVGTAVSSLVSSVVYMAPFILGGVMFYLFNRKAATQPIRYSIKLTPVFPLLILAGLAVITAAAYVNSWFCNLIGYVIPPEMIAPTGYDNASTVIMYMTIGLAPAFAEEFLFRGVIYGNLRVFGKTQAVLISSLLFALMHQNIGQFFYTFVGGMAMALMYELTGSIWCGILFHLLNNELSVLTEVLYYGRYGEAIAPLLILWDIIVLVLGTVSIVILIFYYRRQKRKAIDETVGGIFGKQGRTVPEAYDEPVAPKTVLRGLRTPGMITFSALAFAMAILTYLAIMFIDLGELL